MNRAKNEDGFLPVPAGLGERFAGVVGGMRFEGPRGVGAEFGGHAELVQPGARFLVSRDDEGLLAITARHPFEHRVHFAGFGAIADQMRLRAAAMPSDPIIIVASALANLLLNIEPSQATTPW